MADEDEPQLHVTRPFSPGELAELGKVHPEEAPPEVQLSSPLGYTILISPPDRELIAFSDEKGQDPNRYDGVRFTLLPEGIMRAARSDGTPGREPPRPGS